MKALKDCKIWKEALLSFDETYRRKLYRIWDKSKERVAWIMLNPSTADASVDDPTIRRCMAFAHSWGYGGIEVVNLFDYRATDPKDLKKAVMPCGHEANKYIGETVQRCALVVAAWGSHGAHLGRDKAVLEYLDSTLPCFTLKCLGMTAKGHPKHPLYLKGDTPLITYKEKPAKWQ